MLFFSGKLNLLLLTVFPYQPIHLIIAVFIVFIHVVCTPQPFVSKVFPETTKNLGLTAHLQLYYNGMKQRAGNQRAGFPKLPLII